MVKEYVRARVTYIKDHFDPTAIFLTDEGAAVIAYGVSDRDLIRLKSYLPKLNEMGLILVQGHDDLYSFLAFDEMLVCTYPGFNSAIKEMGLSCGHDLDFSEWTKFWHLDSFKKWMTLTADMNKKARQLASDLYKKLLNDKIKKILGSDPELTLDHLSWTTDSFEPLHALIFLARAELKREVDPWSLENILSKYKLDLHEDQKYYPNQLILKRKKGRATLMDIAKEIFSPTHYFEVNKKNLAKTLNKDIDKIDSHLRGYLAVDRKYLEDIMKKSKK